MEDLHEHMSDHGAQFTIMTCRAEASTYRFELSIGEDPSVASLYYNANTLIRDEAGNGGRRERASSFPDTPRVFASYTQCDSSVGMSRVSTMGGRSTTSNKFASDTRRHQTTENHRFVDRVE